MEKINLSDLENSDIKYKISQFPDGQQDIVIENVYLVDRIVHISSRFNSFRDLELIIATNKAVRRMGAKEVHLYIPYLLGARSDRLFQRGGNSYLVDVIAPILNAQEFKSITVMDVHSDVAPACIENLFLKTNIEFVRVSLSKALGLNLYKDNWVLVSPDAGAQKKIYEVASSIGYKDEIITASKHRDLKSGNIVSTEVDTHKIGNKDCIIIDDICDGGRTFIELAKVIKKFWEDAGLVGNKIYLIVTHGIFSNGYTELLKYFDGIYTTNSIKDIGGLDGNSNKSINVYQVKVI